MKNTERFTIVSKSGTTHYDTNDERFYSDSWERTLDKKSYLQDLINNNPEKFDGCKIEKTV